MALTRRLCRLLVKNPAVLSRLNKLSSIRSVSTVFGDEDFNLKYLSGDQTGRLVRTTMQKPTHRAIIGVIINRLKVILDSLDLDYFFGLSLGTKISFDPINSIIRMSNRF